MSAAPPPVALPATASSPQIAPAPPASRSVPTDAPSRAARSRASRRARVKDLGAICGVLTVATGTGYLVALHSGGVLHDRMLPWILGRSLGLAAYVSLSALVALGIWFRHPWKVARRAPGPEALLRAHVALAAGTIGLLIGHICAIALDHYAGVGWIGVFVPWESQYRPTAVALGSLALYGVVLVVLTAALAGSVARRVWLPVHAIAVPLFCLSLVHGLLAGSDTHVMWWLYAVTGAVVAVLQVSRFLTDRPLSAEVS